MNPWVIGGALALGKIQEKQAQEEAEKAARAKLFMSQARQYGYPTMEAEAMAARQGIDAIEGPNYLGMMMDAEDKKKAQGGKNAELDEKDYFRAFMG
jgi:hypothetical protein